ncbi:RNA-directed DNA polymerase, eukaryota, reverse transcriptase zinc-binding domain protein [Tanacetum coccineum]
MDEVTTKMCVTGVRRIGFARMLVEIDAEKGIKDKIEIIYKSKNVATGTKTIVDVKYSWIPSICSQCKVFGHTNSYYKTKNKNMTDVDKVKENGNEFKVLHNRRYGREGFTKNRRTNIQNGQKGKMWNEGRFGNMNNKWQQNNRFEYMRRRENEGKEKDVHGGTNEDSRTNVISTNNEKASDGKKEKNDNQKSEDTKRYYRDKKELFDAAREIEEIKDVLDENYGVENTVLRNKVEGMERRKLWKDLEIQKIITCGMPWVILGDFNVTLKVSEHSNGSANPSSEMSEFQDCVNSIEVEDLHSEGFHYTWTKSLKSPKCGTLKKLDKIKRSSYQLKLKQLSWGNGNIFERVEELRKKVKESHNDVDMFPHDERVKEKGYVILKEYHEAIQDEYSLLCQKAKVEWLKEGDRNTAYFHKTIVKHFEEFLEALKMVRPISDSEIKNAMFEIKDSKAPGPDGYTLRFYKSAWSIVRKKKNIKENAKFKYHYGCKKLEITHLCFADDLLVFCHADCEAVRIIKKSLDEFSGFSGLLPNMQKIGKLPVRYLGVPLITKQININDCKPLVNKVKAEINDWKNKSLYYAGRVQLITSVLSDLTKGKAKVSWDAVCKSKDQYGLAVYYIWQERNNRLFKNKKMDSNTILNIAKETVDMKLIGIKVNESRTVKEVEERWNVKMQRG